MDLKIVCLLFACILSIALAEDEGKPEDGGSSGECKCEGRGGRGGGRHGWGGKGGKDGKKKCHVFILGLLKECEEMSQQICDYFDTKKDQMDNCWEKDTWDDKKECMRGNMVTAINSPEVEHSAECWSAMTEVFGPKE